MMIPITAKPRPSCPQAGHFPEEKHLQDSFPYQYAGKYDAKQHAPNAVVPEDGEESFAESDREGAQQGGEEGQAPCADVSGEPRFAAETFAGNSEHGTYHNVAGASQQGGLQHIENVGHRGLKTGEPFQDRCKDRVYKNRGHDGKPRRGPVLIAKSVDRMI